MSSTRYDLSQQGLNSEASAYKLKEDTTLVDELEKISAVVSESYNFQLEKFLAKSIAPNEVYKAVIVGGGVGGCLTAIELAKTENINFDITIIEKGPELARGTAQLTPGRLGLGFHYSDVNTALTYLRRTTDFIKRYPGCLITGHLPPNDALRHGRYVVMKNNDKGNPNPNPKPMEVFQVYEKIVEGYQQLVNKDKSNKIWGEPKDFLRILYLDDDEKELRNYFLKQQNQSLLDFNTVLDPVKNQNAKQALAKEVNLKDVAFVVETAEELLNWEECRKKILAELEALAKIKRISWFTNTEVISLDNNSETNCVDVRCSNGKVYPADYPVVCAWERSEELMKKLGIQDSEHTTNRLKSIITISLPDEMKNTPSMFFCMGPYAMFSNFGNGYGKVTYAIKTNMSSVDAAAPLPSEMAYYLSGKVSPDERSAIGQDILLGASNHVLGLEKATIKAVSFGIVKTRGSTKEVSIYNPKGKIGERDYGWVRPYPIPDNNSRIIIQNDSMKITYSNNNGKHVRYLITEHVAIQRMLLLTGREKSPVNEQPPAYARTIIDMLNNPSMFYKMTGSPILQDIIELSAGNKVFAPEASQPESKAAASTASNTSSFLALLRKLWPTISPKTSPVSSPVKPLIEPENRPKRSSAFRSLFRVSNEKQEQQDKKQESNQDDKKKSTALNFTILSQLRTAGLSEKSQDDIRIDYGTAGVIPDGTIQEHETSIKTAQEPKRNKHRPPHLKNLRSRSYIEEKSVPVSCDITSRKEIDEASSSREDSPPRVLGEPVTNISPTGSTDSEFVDSEEDREELLNQASSCALGAAMSSRMLVRSCLFAPQRAASSSPKVSPHMLGMGRPQGEVDSTGAMSVSSTSSCLAK